MVDDDDDDDGGDDVAVWLLSAVCDETERRSPVLYNVSFDRI